jgi:RAB protein geranylgeranyltransferase component A
VYVAVVSSAHAVCPKGYYIAIVSTIAEGDSNHHLELQPGLDRLGKITEIFQGPPIPIYEPLESGQQDKVYISKSYDATSHFESTTGKCNVPGNRTKRVCETDAMTTRRYPGSVPASSWRGSCCRGAARGPESCVGTMKLKQ